MIMYKALHSRDDVDIMCQEKKEEEDLPVFKTVLTHQYKSEEEDELQPSETILTTRGLTKRQ